MALTSGVPEVMCSDNGSNFVDAESQLERKLLGFDQDRIHRTLVIRGSELHSYPPAASHWDRTWKRMIRTVQPVMQAVTREQVYHKWTKVGRGMTVGDLALPIGGPRHADVWPKAVVNRVVKGADNHVREVYLRTRSDTEQRAEASPASEARVGGKQFTIHTQLAATRWGTILVSRAGVEYIRPFLPAAFGEIATKVPQEIRLIIVSVPVSPSSRHSVPELPRPVLRSRTQIRTLKQAALTRTLDLLHIDVCCISETRIHDSSQRMELIAPALSTRYWLYTSGDSPAAVTGQAGVGLVLSTTAAAALIDWIPVNSTLHVVRLTGSVRVSSRRKSVRNLFVVSAYAPADCSDVSVKDVFYSDLAAILRSTCGSDIIVLAGDMNAQVGRLGEAESRLGGRDPDHVDVRPSTLTQMTIDIAEGLAYLHSKDLVHRDIACRNCLVSSDRVVKIGDFGLARKLNNTGNEGYYRFTRNCQLPVRWMSPEAVQLGVFSPQSDIWSYGIVLYEIITFGVLPYGRLGEVEVVERVKQINFSILDFLPPAAVNTTVAGLINQCCQHQWQHRPEKMEVVIQQLREYPDCVRPFLTDEPPKPNRAIDALPFQPGAGACMMSENALTPDGPNPSANNPTSNAVAITDTVSNNHSSAVFGVGHARGFHSTTGSLTGTGRSPLVYYSADSFTDAATTLAARRPLTSESTAFPSGRRRHKTADGAVNSTKNAYLCRGTSSSSGHTGQDSEVSFEDPKGPASDITQEFLHGWCAVGDATPVGGDCVSNSHRNIPNVSRRYRSEHGKRIHDQLSARRHWMCKPGHEVTELTPMLLTRLTGNTGPLPLDKSAGSTPLDLQESVTNGSAAPEPDGHHATQNRLALDKQLNGILSTTIRSLSTGYISSCPSCTDANVALAKSAPDGNPSLYVGISRGKQNVSDVLFHPELSDHHASQHAHTRFGATRTGRHCLTAHGLSAGAPNQSSTLTTRSVVDNASCLLRSVLRMFTRGNKTRALSYPDTGLRCTKSSMSCRALGVTPITDLPTGPLHNQAESGHMSTSCPPLFMAQLSTVGQHLPTMNPHSDPMMLNRDMCIPPVPQRFFPITETVVNQPVATPSDITDCSVRDLPRNELSRSPHELVPLLATNPSIHSLQSKSGATLFSLSSSSPSPTPAPPSSTPPASSTNGLFSNGDHHQSFYLV
ncbi:uncharacterized protein DEA37_0009977 [Paragonimus westermani]|uniref:Protein kinase domain-containing protein n=1 Tax=Paragonimus westermani TaxID=34504 RepID=A0A5J4P4F6_9TREM|nr:uncharacterized protein DEA37_0009977 [Paragonimus westermani]